MSALAHRLLKNHNRLKTWAEKLKLECFRLYERDIPEYPFIVDLYKDYALVYDRSRFSDEPEKNIKMVNELNQALIEVLKIAPSRIVMKRREKQKGKSQYNKQGRTGKSFVVREGEALFEVNLFDYLDTGLFLDHRLVRNQVMKLASGKRFLNLFSYTGSVTVFAALGGAQSSMSVDMSKTYTNWALRNLKLNNIPEKNHKLITQDVLQFLFDPKTTTIGKFDLIFLDPPTFSNSKKMEQTFDVERDQISIVDKCMDLLSRDGLLIFSNNKRGFKLSDELRQKFNIKDTSLDSIPKDFRDKNIHKVFEVRHSK